MFFSATPHGGARDAWSIQSSKPCIKHIFSSNSAKNFVSGPERPHQRNRPPLAATSTLQRRWLHDLRHHFSCGWSAKMVPARKARRTTTASGRPHSHQTRLHGPQQRRPKKPCTLHLQQGLVKGSQLDKKKKSKWAPCTKGPSQWNQAQAILQHPPRRRRRCPRRAWLLWVRSWKSAKCHQDVQVESSGQDNYAAYVAKYAPKFSDAFHEDMLKRRTSMPTQ